MKHDDNLRAVATSVLFAFVLAMWLRLNHERLRKTLTRWQKYARRKLQEHDENNK
jgi:hypothetical protein